MKYQRVELDQTYLNIGDILKDEAGNELRVLSTEIPYLQPDAIPVTTLEIPENPKSSIHKEVVQDLCERERRGYKSYSTTMDRTDLSEKEWLQHLYEELMDAMLYTKKLLKTKDYV